MEENHGGRLQSKGRIHTPEFPLPVSKEATRVLWSSFSIDTTIHDSCRGKEVENSCEKRTRHRQVSKGRTSGLDGTWYLMTTGCTGMPGEKGLVFQKEKQVVVSCGETDCQSRSKMKRNNQCGS